eukprot:superscaffoldBa00002051_g12997
MAAVFLPPPLPLLPPPLVVIITRKSVMTERWISSPGLTDVEENRAEFICRSSLRLPPSQTPRPPSWRKANSPGPLAFVQIQTVQFYLLGLEFNIHSRHPSGTSVVSGASNQTGDEEEEKEEERTGISQNVERCERYSRREEESRGGADDDDGGGGGGGRTGRHAASRHPLERRSVFLLEINGRCNESQALPRCDTWRGGGGEGMISFIPSHCPSAHHQQQKRVRGGSNHRWFDSLIASITAWPPY